MTFGVEQRANTAENGEQETVFVRMLCRDTYPPESFRGTAAGRWGAPVAIPAVGVCSTIYPSARATQYGTQYRKWEVEPEGPAVMREMPTENRFKRTPFSRKLTGACTRKLYPSA
jgi:hypothetical protein